MDGHLARHGFRMGIEGSFRYGLGESGCQGSNLTQEAAETARQEIEAARLADLAAQLDAARAELLEAQNAQDLPEPTRAKWEAMASRKVARLERLRP